jgi:UDP-N-acetyl-D-mannosaminuronic acid transferase (WecB/TagA/CpsF family)
VSFSLKLNRGANKSMSKVNLLNLEFDNLSIKELLRQLKSGVVFTPNVDHLMKLQCDREFFRAYETADYKLCDSQILIYASRFLGTPFKEKISGSDFFPAFYTYHRNNEKIRIFLLGGQKGIAVRAQERINRKVGRNMVVAAYSPSFGFENDERECAEIVVLPERGGKLYNRVLLAR